MIPIGDMTTAISNATDLIDYRLNGHNKRVAYIASHIASCLGLDLSSQIDVILSGYLHDVGVMGLSDKSSLFVLDKEDNEHAEIGYKLLRTMPELHKLSLIVKNHHQDHRLNVERGLSNEVFKSEIINLSDRIDILLDYKKEPLGQRDYIYSWISERSGSRFNPVLVDAFKTIAKVEAFWFHLYSGDFEDELLEKVNDRTLNLDREGLIRFGKLFSQIIDFRSPFTATHSSGVAASAVFLAEWMGFYPKDVELMRIAGYLHDLGKLAVPNAILEKKGRLTNVEFNKIKSHTYHTKRILEKIQDFQEIALWASLHHEKLDGSGYPFHLKGLDIPLGSRIMAIADIFTALNEDRPYRPGVEKEEVIDTLNEMAKEGGIDSELTKLALDHYDELSEICHREQAIARKEYNAFWDLT